MAVERVVWMAAVWVLAMVAMLAWHLVVMMVA